MTYLRKLFLTLAGTFTVRTNNRLEQKTCQITKKLFKCGEFGLNKIWVTSSKYIQSNIPELCFLIWFYPLWFQGVPEFWRISWHFYQANSWDYLQILKRKHLKYTITIIHLNEYRSLYNFSSTKVAHIKVFQCITVLLLTNQPFQSLLSCDLVDIFTQINAVNQTLKLFIAIMPLHNVHFTIILSLLTKQHNKIPNWGILPIPN